MFAGLLSSPPKPAYRQSPLQQSDKRRNRAVNLQHLACQECAVDTDACCPGCAALRGNAAVDGAPSLTAISRLSPWPALAALPARAGCRPLPAEIPSPLLAPPLRWLYPALVQASFVWFGTDWREALSDSRSVLEGNAAFRNGLHSFYVLFFILSTDLLLSESTFQGIGCLFATFFFS